MSSTSTPPQTRTMDRNLIDVSFSLAKHVISAKAQSSNFVFSPLSIHVALALIATGSDGLRRDTLLRFLKSESTEQLNNSLLELVFSVFHNDHEPRGGPPRMPRFFGEPPSGPCLSVANGVWIDQSLSFKASFKETVENVYKASSRQVDFKNKAEKVRKEVNRWAEKETNGLIKEILESGSVHSLTRLIFANAVYFKADWVEIFEPECTKDDAFFLLNRSSIQVPFMLRSGGKEYIGVFDGFKVLRLPYARGKDRKRQFSMYFFLPDARQGLSTLVEKACSESGFIDRHVPREEVWLGRLQIPKFKMEFDFDALEVLKRQGVVLDGGLTEMVNQGGEELFVSKILHKSFIEVNERGTEAAAVTLDYAEESDCLWDDEELEYVDFVADHPFMFVLREDESGAVLFIGQLFDPRPG